MNDKIVNQIISKQPDVDQPPEGTDSISYPRSNDPLWDFINDQWKQWSNQKGAPKLYLFEKPQGQGVMYPTVDAQPFNHWFDWQDLPMKTIFSLYVPMGTRFEVRHKTLNIRTYYVPGLYRDIRHDLKIWDVVSHNVKGIKEKVVLTSGAYSDLEFRWYKMHNYWHLLHRYCLRTPNDSFVIGNRALGIHMRAYCDATLIDYCNQEVHSNSHPWKFNHSVNCKAINAQKLTDRVHGQEKDHNCLNYDYSVDKFQSYAPTNHRICKESPSEVAKYFKERLDNGTHKFVDEGGSSSFSIGAHTYINTRSSGKATELAEFDTRTDNLREQADMEWSEWQTGLVTCVALWVFILFFYHGVDRWGHLLRLPQASSPIFTFRDYLDRTTKIN